MLEFPLNFFFDQEKKKGNSMQDQNLTKITKNVIKFLSKRATELNKTIGFSQRNSKIDAQVFAESLILGCFSDPLISLSGLCVFIKKKVLVTKSGIQQRFNLKAVALMKGLLESAIKDFKTEQVKIIDLLKDFKSVYLIDSTGISLPATMKDIYKGPGGGASVAGLKLQVLIDYVKGHIESITMTNAVSSDQGFKQYLDFFKPNCLYLQDLGYFSVKTFTKIIKMKAYFISRFLTQTNVYDENGVLIDLLTELRQTKVCFSKKVTLKNKLPIRLVGYRLPLLQAEKRIKELKKASKKRGYTPKKISLELAKWAICITNIDESMLKDEHIYLVYTVRWQIELFFKLCKSNLGLDKIQGKTTPRVLCEIYAKLICAVLLIYLCFPQRWQSQDELSNIKSYNLLHNKMALFCQALKSTYRLKKFLISFHNDLKDFALKEKPNKNKIITYQALTEAAKQQIILC